MEIHNEFYVSLLSNASGNIHKNNTLSTFTNQLSKACRLDQSWVVGLVEIGINNYKKHENIKSNSVESYNQIESFDEKEIIQSQSESSDEDYEIVTEIKRRKRSGEFMEINYGSETDVKKIFLYKNDFKQIAYNTNNINFGDFLQLLEKNINREKTKRVFKEKIIKFLNTIDSIPDGTKLSHDDKDFLLRIYQGKSKPDIVTLKLDFYNGIQPLFRDIIRQIPKQNRIQGSLLHTVNNGFYPLHQIEKTVAVNKKSKLEIPFKKHKAKIVPNLEKLKPLADGSVNLNDFIANIDDFIKYNDEEHQGIKNELKENIDNLFDDLNPKEPQILVPDGDNTFQLNVPIENDKTHSVNVENKDYKSIGNFLKEIFLQVPIEKRNKEAFEDALENLHGIQKQVEVINKTNLIQKSESLVVDSAMDLLYVYTDIIQPRLIGHIASRYLKVIPLVTGEKSFRYNRIEYCPIQPSFIESISILITDGDGNKINFDKSSIPTYVLLHFKKI